MFLEVVFRLFSHSGKGSRWSCQWSLNKVSTLCSGSIVVTIIDCAPWGPWFESPVGANILWCSIDCTGPGSDWPGGLPGDSRWAGRLVGRLAGGQQKYYDHTIFFWPLMLSKHDCLSRVVMANRLRRKTVKIKLWCSILFQMWCLAITSLYKQSCFLS